MIGSRIYKDLTTSELNKINTGLFGSSAKINESRLLRGGMFNTTYYVESSGYDVPLVLRVAPVNKHLLFDFEKDMMSAEPMLHNLLKTNNIPTTEIVAYSEEEAIIDREFIVIEYMDSIVMNDPSLANINLDSINEEIGKITRKIHRIKGRNFGWLRNSGWGEFNSWPEFIKRFAKEIQDRSLEYNVIDEASIIEFSTIINTNLKVFETVKVPYMTHMDLWKGNILLQKDNNNYRIAAVIDLDRTIFGDSAFDLACPWITNEQFYDGYGKESDDGSLELRKRIYRLMLGFFEAYVWLVEYANEERYNLRKEEAKRLLSEFNCNE